ncbi:hypothetical protein M0R45_019689 [Rubus argutus]|uniref:Uncharacterized protein n=1 Tax=Rubus argutus TaxID=59490 RepID=A0AAW1X881_RUBAR
MPNPGRTVFNSNADIIIARADLAVFGPVDVPPAHRCTAQSINLQPKIEAATPSAAAISKPQHRSTRAQIASPASSISAAPQQPMTQR